MRNAIRFPLFVLLALLAVTAALAAPVCDAWEAPTGAAHPADCCVVLTDGAPAAPEVAAALAAKPQMAAVAETVWPKPLSWRVDLPVDRPPLSRPYHTRSARILV